MKYLATGQRGIHDTTSLTTSLITAILLLGRFTSSNNNSPVLCSLSPLPTSASFPSQLDIFGFLQLALLLPYPSPTPRRARTALVPPLPIAVPPLWPGFDWGIYTTTSHLTLLALSNYIKTRS